MTTRQYEALADFRYQLRKFLRCSEELVRRHGVTPLQYQLMLQIKGYPGRQRATIGELAERLQAKHNGIVALATRCERQGLIERQASERDGREVHLVLSAAGHATLERLARLHRDELFARRNELFVRQLIEADAT
jgi:DNA-binding MarR family transcriptional regulator